MPTEEQIKRLREIAASKRNMRTQREQPGPPGFNLGQPVEDALSWYENVHKTGMSQPFIQLDIEKDQYSSPIASLIEKLQFGDVPEDISFGYPSRDIIKRDPSREAGVSKTLQDMEFLGREGLSRSADITSGLTRGLIPKEIGEALDPSKETAAGIESAQAIDNLKKSLGREPTRMEKYEIIKPVQDKYKPWLTEKNEVFGVEFDNRALHEGYALGASVVAESIATGGLAKLGTTLGFSGRKLITKMPTVTTADRLKKQTARTIVTGVSEGLKTARRVEDAFGKLLFLPFRAAKEIGSNSMQALSNLTNRFRKDAILEGMPLNEANRKAVDGVNQEIKAGRVKGKSTQETTTINDPDLFNSDLDAPIKASPQSQVYTKAEFKPNKYMSAEDVLRSYRHIPRLTRNFIGNFPGAKGLIKFGTKIKNSDLANELRRTYTNGFKESLSDLLNQADSHQTLDNQMFKDIFDTVSNLRLLNITYGQGIDGKEITSKIIRDAKDFDNAGKELESGLKLSEIMKSNPYANDIIRDEDLFGTAPIDINALIDRESVEALELYVKNGTIKLNQYGNLATDKRAPATINTILRTYDQIYPKLAAKSKVLTDEDIAKNPLLKLFGKKTGDEINVAEMIEPIVYPKKFKDTPLGDMIMASGLEEELASLKITAAFKDPTGHYFPSGMISEDANKISSDAFDYAPGRKPSFQARYYGSDAQSKFYGNAYMGAADALNEMHRKTVKARSAQSTDDMKLMLVNNYKSTMHGNLEEIVGANNYRKLENSLGKIKIKLNNFIQTRGNKDKASIDLAEEILADIDYTFTLRAKLIPDISDNLGDLVREEMQYLGQRIAYLNNEITKLTRKKIGWTPQDRVVFRTEIKNLNKIYKDIKENAFDDLPIYDNKVIESYGFPKQLNAAMVELEKERGQIVGGLDPKIGWLRLAFMRTLMATADISQIGIHGWGNLINDTLRETKDFVVGKTPGVNRDGNSFTSIKDSFKALFAGDDSTLQEYIRRKTSYAMENNLPTPRQAINDGVAWLPNAPDMLFQGAGLPTRIQKMLRPFERGFVQYGNTLRYDSYINEIEDMVVATGKSIDELRADGTLAEIASTINLATGVGRRGFGGAVGQFVYFAPQYNQSKIAMWAKTIRGTAKGKNATPGEAYARKHIGQVLGAMFLATVVINEAQGKDTDVMPFLKSRTGKWFSNPNFLKTNFLDQQTNLFGHYINTYKWYTIPLIAFYNWKNTGFEEHPLEVMKDLTKLISAPAISLAVDLIRGEDPIGRKTRGEYMGVEYDENTGEFIEVKKGWKNVFFGGGSGPDIPIINAPISDFWIRIMENFIPINASDFYPEAGDPDIQDQILSNPARGIANITAQTGIGVIGQTSVYKTPKEMQDEMFSKLITSDPNHPDHKEMMRILNENLGLTKKELEIIFAEAGRGLWNKGDINLQRAIRSLVLGETEPNFSNLRDSIRKEIKKAAESGAFPETVPQEEYEKQLKRLEELREDSADEFNKLQVLKEERTLLLEEDMQKTEDKFLEGNMSNISTFLYSDSVSTPGIRSLMKRAAEDNRNLTDRFPKVTRLFDQLRDANLKIDSSLDVDMYDYARNLYYETLWGEGGIPNPKTLSLDWDKKEQLIEKWSEDLKNKFGSITDNEIITYLYEIERTDRNQAGDVGNLLLTMQDAISESGYYNLGKDVLKKYVSESPDRAAAAEEWKNKTQADRDKEDTPRWIERWQDETKRVESQYLLNNPEIDVMFQIVGTRAKRPVSNHGTLMKNFFERYNRVPENRRKEALNKEKLLTILDLILSDEYTESDKKKQYDTLYSVLYGS